MRCGHCANKRIYLTDWSGFLLSSRGGPSHALMITASTFMCVNRAKCESLTRRFDCISNGELPSHPEWLKQHMHRPARLISNKKKRGIRIRSCIRMHTHGHTQARAHTHTHTDEEQTSKQWRWRHTDGHTPTEAGRSFSTSQGQWHTSAWIITLSHSASRQRITSCTETSAGGGGRRQRKRRLEGKAGEEEETNTRTHTHTLFYASSVRQPVDFL